GLDPGSAGVDVALDDGTRMTADRVVVTAGPWLPGLLPPPLRRALVRLRRVLAWSAPEPRAQAKLRSLPVWGAFLQHGFFYGFPYTDEGVAGLKLACHTNFLAEHAGALGEPVDPDEIDRDVTARDLDPLAEILAAHIPSGVGSWAHHTVCMYTATPSWDFLVDRAPDDPRIVVAGGFSGHGFKFAPAMGRLVAELTLTDADARQDFSFARHLGDAS
ncbi:MAG: FAD-dependent oxidoreductase, partial [Myxococcota bacterium]